MNPRDLGPIFILFVATMYPACGGARVETRGSAAPAAVDRMAVQDTGRTAPPASIRILGRVLVSSHYGLEVAESLPGGFVAHSPIAGATVQAIRNAIVNGVRSQAIAAEVRSDSAGVYEMPPLPGGYYIVSATAPQGSPLRGFPELVPLTARAHVDIYLGLPRQYDDVAADTSRDWNLEMRLAALDAFHGRRAPFEASWTQHGFEGQPIKFRVRAASGRMDTEEDHRAAGGTMRRFAFSRVDLVRLVPSVWVNSREFEKGSLILVQPSEARSARGRYRLGINCMGRVCERLY